MRFFGWEVCRERRGDGRDTEWNTLFAALSKLIELLKKKEAKIMVELSELKATSEQAVAKLDQLNTALDQVRVDMDAIKSELEALKNAGLTPEQKAMVDATHANLITALAKIDETMSENVPVTPPPTDPSVPEV